MNIHHLFVEASAEADRLAHGVAPEQTAGPTPCPEYDTRALLNHWIVYTSHGLEHRARRTTLPEELTTRDFVGEPDWADAYGAQLRRGVAAWAEPAVWEGEIDFGGGGTMPATEIAAMLLLELVLHGWDVARATGQEYRASVELGEAVEGIVARYAQMYREYDGFAVAVVVPEGATAFERAIGASGRDLLWKP
ncbi:TIGR03086 family metal-binding protein [Embleya scabrispora]|uniref:TIGR03086 family metal-binding protein n=1 Tax=Embleya scabrispora TaxID=159449 RepID=UPI000372B82B|nr:TIGR03086 family metal-binding protein [Embleya scabrispora]MYS79532.1 TIGR03086 family protein [Streptomyces sp. SID5474]